MPGLFRRMKEDEDDEMEVVLRQDPQIVGSYYCGGRFSKCSLGTIIFESLVITSLIIALAFAHVKAEACPKEEYSHAEDVLEPLTCKENICMEAVGDILSKMNTSVDPCEDFYTYACGNFVDKQFLSPSQSTVSSMSALSDANLQVVYMGLVDKNRTKLFGKESTALRKARKLHELCMDMKTLQLQGAAPLVKAMETFGSWPVSQEEFNASSWNFSDQLLKLHAHSFTPLLSFVVYSDEKNSSAYSIYFGQSGLTLQSEKSYNITLDPKRNSALRKAVIDYGVAVGSILGVSENVTRTVMEEIYDFEAKLAAINVPIEYLRNPTLCYHKVSVGEVQKIFNSTLDLLPFLHAMMNRTDLTANTTLITCSKPYVDNLKPILDEYLQGDKQRILNNYLVWKLVDYSVDHLGADFQFSKLILKEVSQGVNNLGERWKDCTDAVGGKMDRVTGALFVEGRFGTDERNAVLKMLSQVKDTLTDNFPGYKWMDKKTTEAAIEKAKAVLLQAGFPDYITDAKEVDDHYKDLESFDTYFDFLLHYNRWYRLFNSAKLDKQPDRKEWQMSASIVNAYYSSHSNGAVLPAGILQRPFYHPQLPLSWTYGGMGAVIGHELIHGFDDQGSQYDLHGNLNNWWTNDSVKAFREASQCIVNQYSNYKMGGTPVNGQLTLGENLADNGGLSIAYKAYLQSVEDNNIKPMMLPGLDFTDRQLFFLSFAQVWCQRATPEHAQSSLYYDPHSPPKYRVQGTFSNSREFAQAFQCKAGSSYNPHYKCKVW